MDIPLPEDEPQTLENALDSKNDNSSDSIQAEELPDISPTYNSSESINPDPFEDIFENKQSDDSMTNLPGDEDLENIPVPEDNNRYSPSLPIEDDPPELKYDISEISLPALPPKISLPSTSVLGKEAAKKRLLAFSMSKQSILSQKKTKSTSNDSISKDIPKDNESKGLSNFKKKKKGAQDKARDTISEIEEIKRRENVVRESMSSSMIYSSWASVDSKLILPTVAMQEVQGKLDEVDIPSEKEVAKRKRKAEKVLERQKREEEKQRRREKRGREKIEREKRRSPQNWSEFTNMGFKAYLFRRVKINKEKLDDSKNRQARYHVQDRKLNLLETPMIMKKSVITVWNNVEKKFPFWSVKETVTRPQLCYSYNPKVVTSWTISRKQMLDSLPDNIYRIVKTFFATSSLNSLWSDPG